MWETKRRGLPPWLCFMNCSARSGLWETISLSQQSLHFLSFIPMISEISLTASTTCFPLPFSFLCSGTFTVAIMARSDKTLIFLFTKTMFIMSLTPFVLQNFFNLFFLLCFSCDFVLFKDLIFMISTSQSAVHHVTWLSASQCLSLLVWSPFLPQFLNGASIFSSYLKRKMLWTCPVSDFRLVFAVVALSRSLRLPWWVCLWKVWECVVFPSLVDIKAAFGLKTPPCLDWQHTERERESSAENAHLKASVCFLLCYGVHE